MKNKTFATFGSRVLAADCCLIDGFLFSGAWKKSISAPDMTRITAPRKNKQNVPTIKHLLY